uniref:Uncharacterized protein n=1 Tax=Nothobranchius furzeri TaxID=105023 RepID=A0A8C6KW17_NOTFU
MNVGILNNAAGVKEIKKKIEDCITNNRGGQIEPTIIWGTVKAVMRGNLISRTAYLNKRRKQEQISLEQQLRSLEKKQHEEIHSSMSNGFIDKDEGALRRHTKLSEQKLTAA